MKGNRVGGDSKGTGGLSWDVGSGGSQEGKMVRDAAEVEEGLAVVRRGRGHGG